MTVTIYWFLLLVLVNTCSTATDFFRKSETAFGSPEQVGNIKLFNRRQAPYELFLGGQFQFFDGARGTSVFVSKKLSININYRECLIFRMYY